MKAKMRNGKVFEGKLAKTLVRIGVAESDEEKPRIENKAKVGETKTQSPPLKQKKKKK